MIPSERNTPQQIQGIVRMVYDICDAYGVMPTPEDYYRAIKHWVEDEVTPKTLFEHKPEVNLIKNEEQEAKVVYCKGEYLLATKWSDGDPQDHWCVGFFSHMLGDRYIVVDGEGKPFRANGFRRAHSISKVFGQWMLDHAKQVEDSDLPIWDYWFANYPKYEKEIQ